MTTLDILEQLKSPRQRIIEVYLVERTVPKTIVRLKSQGKVYRSSSFVRKVVHEYRELLQSSPLPEAV